MKVYVILIIVSMTAASHLGTDSTGDIFAPLQSGGNYGNPNPPQGDNSPNAPANYQFQYQIADSASRNYFGHQESRLVDDTQGSYYVRLPGDDSYTVFAYRINPNGLNDPLVPLPLGAPRK